MLFFMQMVDLVLLAKTFLFPYLVSHDRLTLETGMRILSDSACRGQGSGVVDIHKVTECRTVEVCIDSMGVLKMVPKACSDMEWDPCEVK